LNGSELSRIFIMKVLFIQFIHIVKE
jgi:hypothetical protein